MFLENVSEENHELDFRFEVFPEQDRFIFVHHGLNLVDLNRTIDLSSFGSTFFILGIMSPFSTAEVIHNPRLFEERYGVIPSTHGPYLHFDTNRFKRFLEATKDDSELDCTILGANQETISEQMLPELQETAHQKEHYGYLTHSWQQSFFDVHDNHFMYIAGRSIQLLRRLIAESIVGFFNHVYPCDYSPIPPTLIDFLLSNYSTVPIVCVPRKWDEEQLTEIPGDIQVDETEVRAFLTTSKSSWTAQETEFSERLLGRQFLVVYAIQNRKWSWNPIPITEGTG